MKKKADGKKDLILCSINEEKDERNGIQKKVVKHRKSRNSTEKNFSIQKKSKNIDIEIPKYILFKSILNTL